MVEQGVNTIGQTLENRGNALPLPFRIIKVIHASSIGMSASCRKGVLSITFQKGLKAADQLEKRLRPTREPITFGDNDLEGTSQPYDDTLVMASRIGGF